MEEAEQETSQVEDMDEDHDIYGDLESSIFMSTNRAVASNPDDMVKIETLLKENGDLKKRVGDLNQQNKTLLKNISSLYLTATKVIEKKNFIINELQQKLKDSVLSRGHTRNFTIKEIEDILNQCQQACVESQYKICLEEIKQAISENVQKSNQSCKTKSLKYGNMSWYFVNYDSMCERFEQIEFPSLQGGGNSRSGAENKIDDPEDLKEISKPKVKTSRHNETNTETNLKKETHNSENKIIEHTRTNNRHEDEMQKDPPEKIKRDVPSSKSSKCNSEEDTSCNSESIKSNPRYARENKESTNNHRSSSRDYRRSERINKGFSTRYSRVDRLSRKSAESRGYSSERSSSRSNTEDRRRDVRDRNPRVDRSNSKSSYPYSENTRRDGTRSSKRHRRDIS